MGSTLSVRSMCRLGGEVSFADVLYFQTAATYIRENAGDVEAHVGGARALTLTSYGGTLHGTWQADSVIMTSDRRLKENIRPLVQSLKTNHHNQTASEQVDSNDKALPTTINSDESATSWVLRQLRPVSYNFRQGTDSKNVRFGFIADEMEKILPQVVRPLNKAQQRAVDPDPDSDAKDTEDVGGGPKKEKEKEPEIKGIVYPDLIAVLASVVKDLGSQMQAMQGRMRLAEVELDRLDEDEPMDTSPPRSGPTETVV